MVNYLIFNSFIKYSCDRLHLTFFNKHIRVKLRHLKSTSPFFNMTTPNTSESVNSVIWFSITVVLMRHISNISLLLLILYVFKTVLLYKN